MLRVKYETQYSVMIKTCPDVEKDMYLNSAKKMKNVLLYHFAGFDKTSTPIREVEQEDELK